VLEVLLDRQLVWSIILFPITIAPLVVLSLGVAWWLAALGVYFRDISQITGVMVTALLFTSTAIMPLSAVSPSFRLVFELNPLTFIIDQSRSVVLWGELPNWIGLGVYLLGATIFAFCGYCMFAAVRRGFSDVI
jgi:lipopolysaccharide transport system permease protein